MLRTRSRGLPLVIFAVVVLLLVLGLVLHLAGAHDGMGTVIAACLAVLLVAWSLTAPASPAILAAGYVEAQGVRGPQSADVRMGSPPPDDGGILRC